MQFIKAGVILLCAAPLFAQRAEVYGLGGYSRTKSGSLSANSSFYGASAGVRVVSIIGIQGEFFQVRSSSQWSSINTGALNLVLEKRTGRIRPGAIVPGVGGGSSGKDSFFTVQFGDGVALQLIERLYVRPQVRVHGRLGGNWLCFSLSGCGGSSPDAVIAGVALGYRF